MRTSPGRPRTLDRNKKTLFCDAVSRGATMTEAAVTVGVSLRTVQREARLDPHFDQELRLAHTDKPDPLAIMQSAARTHWRAAAWLLERTKPEDYGRRPASSCSPYQFEEALKVVIDAALRLAPPENHAKVYAELTAASETAFKAVFPNYGPYGRHLVKRLPDTPLANAQRLEVLRNPPPGRIARSAELAASPDPFEPTTHLQPRALPGRNPPLPDTVATRIETPGRRPGLQISELAASNDRAAATHHEEPDPYAAPYLHPRALPADPPPSQQPVAADQQEVALADRAAATSHDEPKPQPPVPAPQSATKLPNLNPAPTLALTRLPAPTPTCLPSPKPSPEHPTPDSRLPWQYDLRVANTNPIVPSAPISASITHPPVPSHLSPKTGPATKFNPSDIPLRDAPVSRDAVAERGPEPIE